jgi:hypothetical protein
VYILLAFFYAAFEQMMKNQLLLLLPDGSLLERAQLLVC